MAPDYTLAYNKNTKGFALYRGKDLKATWSDDPLIDVKPYVDSQVAMRAGVDSVIEEITVDWKGWPEELPKAEKPAVGTKKASKAAEATVEA